MRSGLGKPFICQREKRTLWRCGLWREIIRVEVCFTGWRSGGRASSTGWTARFSREAQLLIWDANFTEEDRKIHPGWGHSSWEQGLWLARESKVKMVLMTHFSREYTDECLRQQQKLAEGEDQICRFAKEGMVIRL